MVWQLALGLLLQRTPVHFLAPTWWLTTVYDSSPELSDIFLPPQPQTHIHTCRQSTRAHKAGVFLNVEYSAVLAELTEEKTALCQRAQVTAGASIKCASGRGGSGKL